MQCQNLDKRMEFLQIPSQSIAFFERCGIDSRRLVTVEQKLAVVRANLEKSSSQLNLSRLTKSVDFWIKHVADSLALCLVMPGLLTGGWRLADIGPGAGFPVLALATVNPALKCWGIEPASKKVEFIKQQIAELELDNCDTLNASVKAASHLSEFQHSFDVVVARAVGRGDKLIRESRLLLRQKAESAIVLYKTPQQIGQEEAVLNREAEKYRLTVQFSEVFDLPLNAGKRQFVMVKRKIA